MLKLILILILGTYVFYKAFTFVLKLFFGSANMHMGSSEQRTTRPKSGNVNIDYIPREKRKKGSEGGGEYVDFEEVD